MSLGSVTEPPDDVSAAMGCDSHRLSLQHQLSQQTGPISASGLSAGTTHMDRLGTSNRTAWGHVKNGAGSVPTCQDVGAFLGVAQQLCTAAAWPHRQHRWSQYLLAPPHKAALQRNKYHLHLWPVTLKIHKSTVLRIRFHAVEEVYSSLQWKKGSCRTPSSKGTGSVRHCSEDPAVHYHIFTVFQEFQDLMKNLQPKQPATSAWNWKIQLSCSGHPVCTQQERDAAGSPTLTEH